MQRIVLAYVRTDEQLLLTSLGKAIQIRIAGCSDTGWEIERQVAMRLILCTRKMKFYNLFENYFSRFILLHLRILSMVIQPLRGTRATFGPGGSRGDVIMPTLSGIEPQLDPRDYIIYYISMYYRTPMSICYIYDKIIWTIYCCRRKLSLASSFL